MSEVKTAAELAAEAKAVFDRKHDEVKAIAEKALAEAEKGAPLASTAKELADEAIVGMNEAKARLDELEQKVARQRDIQETARKSLGETVTDNEAIKAFIANGGKGRVGVDIDQ